MIQLHCPTCNKEVHRCPARAAVHRFELKYDQKKFHAKAAKAGQSSQSL